MKKSEEEQIMKLKRRVSIAGVVLLLLLVAGTMASAYVDAVSGIHVLTSAGALNLVLPPLSGAMLLSEKNAEMR